jgi:hypothetical protein
MYTVIGIYHEQYICYHYTINGMRQSYTKSCMFCKQEIVMSDRGAGKWLPYDLNGSVHDCKTNSTSAGTNKVETKPLSLEELDARLKRVESIVIGPRK